MKIIVFTIFVIASACGDVSHLKDLNITENEILIGPYRRPFLLAKINNEEENEILIDLPELPDPEALTVKDVEKFGEIVEKLKNVMDTLDDTLYIYDKLKIYFTEVKKRIDEFLSNNPKFIDEVKYYYDKIVRYLGLKKDQVELNEEKTKTKRDLRTFAGNEDLKKEITNFFERLQFFLEKLSKMSKEEKEKLTVEDYKQMYNEFFAIEHKEDESKTKTKRDLRTFAENEDLEKKNTDFIERLRNILKRLSKMSKEEKKKLTKEDYKKYFDELFPIEHREDVTETKTKRDLETFAKNENVKRANAAFIERLRNLMEKLSKMSKEEKNKLTREDYKNYFDELFPLDHKEDETETEATREDYKNYLDELFAIARESGIQNSSAEIDDKVISYIKAAK